MLKYALCNTSACWIVLGIEKGKRVICGEIEWGRCPSMMQMLRFREEKYVAGANVTVQSFTWAEKRRLALHKWRGPLPAVDFTARSKNSRPDRRGWFFPWVFMKKFFLDPLPVKCFQHGKHKDKSINYSQSTALGRTLTRCGWLMRGTCDVYSKCPKKFTLNSSQSRRREWINKTRTQRSELKNPVTWSTC